jgi:hypothetical protein
VLDRFFGRSRPARLEFSRRECVLVPQTPTRFALHADVHFEATSRRGATIDDAHLVWERLNENGQPPGEMRRSRWDRAVVDGRFRYPPLALDTRIGEEPRQITLTFTDPLIPHGPEAPPSLSCLTIDLSFQGKKSVRTRLWEISMTSWDGANIRWLPGAQARRSSSPS